MNNYYIVIGVLLLLFFSGCDQESPCNQNYNVDWSTIDCDDLTVAYKIASQINYSGCIDAGVMECIIDSNDESLFQSIYDRLSKEEKQATFNNYSLLLVSIYSGNIYAFKKLLPFYGKYIHTPRHHKYMIEHIIQYCHTEPVLFKDEGSPISKLDSMVGIEFLEEYFRYDSIQSVTIQNKLKAPILFLSIGSLRASKYLIEKGADINCKIPSPDPEQEDFYYLERFILNLIYPPVSISYEGEERSFYTERKVYERLDMVDFIISKGGIMKNKVGDNPYLFLLKEAIKANNLSVLKIAASRYKTIYDSNYEKVLRLIKNTQNIQTKDYLTNFFYDNH